MQIRINVGRNGRTLHWRDRWHQHGALSFSLGGPYPRVPTHRSSPRDRSYWVFALFVLGIVNGMVGISSHEAAGQANSADEQVVRQSPHGHGVRVPPGFVAEKLYEVPADKEGSWVSLATLPNGRLATSDQYGQLFEITLPTATDAIHVRELPVELGRAQGLLFALGSLYAMVNDERHSGLYRAKDTNGDGTYDDVQRLLELDGHGEHGPHAVILSPDREWLYVCAGNMTALPKLTGSFVPQVWREDLLLERLWDPQGHAVGIMAPGGWICRVSPDGSKCELVAIGFRNHYDIAFNDDGELFTFDSDMEWDMGTAWYRPTRIVHVLHGADFGWRSGTGVWPEYQPDTLPSVANLGPGSPTGVAFGSQAHFPEKYRRAMFACDWSHGRIFALQLHPRGISYLGEAEVFASAPALPVTDLVVHPDDGAMYFVTGGRRLQSALYRVQYEGEWDRGPATPTASGQASPISVPRSNARSGDAKGSNTSESWRELWPLLANDDRFVRYQARTRLEHQPSNIWQDQAVTESHPRARIEALVALARCGQPDDQPRMLGALHDVAWQPLSTDEKLAMLRAYGLALLRLGQPDDVWRKRIVQRFLGEFPAQDVLLNRELARLLAYLQADGFRSRALEHLERQPSMSEKTHYLLALSVLDTDWPSHELERYYEQLILVKQGGGGKSYGGYIDAIEDRLFGKLTAHQQAPLAPWRERLSVAGTFTMDSLPQTGLVKQWTKEELLTLADKPLDGRDLERGRHAFAKANCFTCHRVHDQGGVQGPDLSSVGGRLGLTDIMITIADPSFEVSDQYASYAIELKDGDIVQGRVVDLNGELWYVATDMANPGKRESVRSGDVLSMRPTNVSPMPEGLLNVLTEDEILDLLAYMSAQRGSE